MMGICCGLIGRLKVDEIAENFVLGAKDMVFAAICIGLARAIVVILGEGNIMDSVINGLATIVSWLPASLSAIGMLLVQTALNIFASGSGRCNDDAYPCTFRRHSRVTRQVSVWHSSSVTV